MFVLIFMAVLMALAVAVNRYYTAQNKKKFAEADERLAKEENE